MATPSPYRSLPAAQRVALVTAALKASRETRALYVQRLVARGGGFRAVTLQSWPVDRLAKELVRLNAETPQDELDLLHLLYIELEPAIQITMLDAAGVPHTNGRIDEAVDPPYTDAATVRRAAAAVQAAHGDDGLRYLRTLARYNPDGWPEVEAAVSELSASGSAALAPARDGGEA